AQNDGIADVAEALGAQRERVAYGLQPRILDGRDAEIALLREYQDAISLEVALRDDMRARRIRRQRQRGLRAQERRISAAIVLGDERLVVHLDGGAALFERLL